MSSTTVAHCPDGSATVDLAGGGALPNDALSAIVTTTGFVGGTLTGGSSVTGFPVVVNSAGDDAPEAAACAPAFATARGAPAAGGCTLRACAFPPDAASADAPPPNSTTAATETASHLRESRTERISVSCPGLMR
jgi:hypothetical protein